MFDIDLQNNPATALTAGTASNLTFSLGSTPNAARSVRSVSAVATTLPHILAIAHTVRSVKGLTWSATKQKAPDLLIDRHLIRVDKACSVSNTGLFDPTNAVTYGAQLVIEVPRGLAAGDAPTVQQVMDQVLRLVVALNPSSNAGLVRLLNLEL